MTCVFLSLNWLWLFGKGHPSCFGEELVLTACERSKSGSMGTMSICLPKSMKTY